MDNEQNKNFFDRFSEWAQLQLEVPLRFCLH